MSLRIAREFVAQQGGWECFFATTYTFELELFDEYLFRRLGEPPVNATVLCDFDCLARRLGRIGPEETRLLQRANRDYLLRGVSFGGAFHPKTYLLANRRRGVLLVGSGNLSLRGIEQGREVFCRFDSANEADLATIRTWRDWVDDLVGRIQDGELTHRWVDLKDRTLDWLHGPAASSPFVSNLQVSILDQLSVRVTSPIEELHVLAPFYDRNAQALARLLGRVVPERLVLYLGAGTSVDGPSLERILEGSASKVQVRVLEPNEFVHAKLIGAIRGEGGWLLSGSANLSNAALTAAVTTDTHSNVEAGILIETSAEAVRAAFVPPDFSFRVEGIAAVRDLELTVEEPRDALPLRLLSARSDENGRVAVRVSGVVPARLLVTAGQAPRELEEGRTAQPLERAEGGTLVWLCGESGEQLSNKTVLDDPVMLGHWLEERQRGGDLPSGIDAVDVEQPVGQFLVWLNEQCIFDIDDTRAAARARRLVSEEPTEGDPNWEFVSALAREEIQLDPRIDRYRHAGRGLALDDEVFLLLELMLGKTPAERGLHLVSVPPPKPPDEPGKGRPWSMEQRIQARVFNVLSRWCSALSDPRFIWIDRSAPVRNYVALLAGLARCWEEAFLPLERVRRLLETLLTSFIAGERTAGYLTSLSVEERAAALDRLPNEARAVAAALCYATLRENADWKEWVFPFQPFLEPGLELGLLAADEDATELVERLVDEKPTTSALEARLAFASTYLDDPHWCAKQERDLGIDRVRLTHEQFAAKFGITLAVNGVTLDDARLVSLVRQALAYRRVNGAILDVGGARLSVHLGDPIFAGVDGQTLETADSYDLSHLIDLERRGIGFMHVLRAADAA